MRYTLHIYGRLTLKTDSQEPNMMVASIKGMDHFISNLMEALRSEFPKPKYDFLARPRYNNRYPITNESYKIWVTPSQDKPVKRFDEIEKECKAYFWKEIEANPGLKAEYLEQSDEQKKKWLE